MVTYRLPVAIPGKGENGIGKGRLGFILAVKKKCREFRKDATIGWRKGNESNPNV